MAANAAKSSAAGAKSSTAQFSPTAGDLVSVPSPGSAKTSITIIVGPRESSGSIFPVMSPITSLLPPPRACITIFTSASAETFTCLKYRASRVHGLPARAFWISALSNL